MPSAFELVAANSLGLHIHFKSRLGGIWEDTGFIRPDHAKD